MKKNLLTLCTLIIMLSLTGMSIKLNDNKQSISLKDGEVFIDLKSNGDVLYSMLFTRKNFDKSDFMSEGDTDKDIIKKLQDGPLPGKIMNFKRTKDIVEYQVLNQGYVVEATFPHITLKEYLERTLGLLNNSDGSDRVGTSNLTIDTQKLYKSFAQSQGFILFSNGKKVNYNDISKYTNDNILGISGIGKGAYYEVPSEILLVSGKVKYKKISKNTIYVQGSQDGYIIVKKYSITTG